MAKIMRRQGALQDPPLVQALLSDPRAGWLLLVELESDGMCSVTDRTAVIDCKVNGKRSRP